MSNSYYSFVPMEFLDSALSEDWKRAIDLMLNTPVEVLRIGIVGGGSINDARKIETSQGIFFAKLNDASQFPGMFEAEMDGLIFLKKKCKFNIPKPISTGITGDTQWILMDYIAAAPKSDSYWEDFGTQLALLHKETAPTFGYEKPNYLGSLRQWNEQCTSWPEFFAEKRLRPQLKMAVDREEASGEMKRLLEKVLSRVERYFSDEPPAALHGDLWTGNFSTDQFGNATIYDPAVYFGHREMDIAMSKLFGSFDHRFYLAYNDAYPLQSGWEERIHIANLYPLLAHLNIFGGSYSGQIMTILRRYA